MTQASLTLGVNPQAKMKLRTAQGRHPTDKMFGTTGDWGPKYRLPLGLDHSVSTTPPTEEGLALLAPGATAVANAWSELRLGPTATPPASFTNRISESQL